MTDEIHAPLGAHKRVALVAHDHKKRDLVEWCRIHLEELKGHSLYATGTTGRVISAALGLKIEPLLSGPLGGDQQLGAMIAEARIDALVFFWDPLEAQPHDPDVKALLRLAAVWNIPMACNLATADFLITSPFMAGGYDRRLPDYSAYLKRQTT
jgi:methylglyoxal synthase